MNTHIPKDSILLSRDHESLNPPNTHPVQVGPTEIVNIFSGQSVRWGCCVCQTAPQTGWLHDDQQDRTKISKNQSNAYSLIWTVCH